MINNQKVKILRKMFKLINIALLAAAASAIDMQSASVAAMGRNKNTDRSNSSSGSCNEGAPDAVDACR